MKDILIVEDDIDLLEILTDILKDHGYSVRACLNVESVREFLDGEQVRLALIDLMLPDGSGVAVAVDVKENGNSKTILMSSSKEKLREMSTHPAIDAVMEKPFPLEKLTDLIDTAAF